MVAPSHPMLITPWHTLAYGVCDKINQTIYLSNLLYDFQLQEVLCHELAHAVLYSYGIEMSYDEEEIVADIVANYGNEIINLSKIIFDKIKMPR